MPEIHTIVNDIENHTQQKLTNYQLTAVGGGSINASYHLQATGSTYFIKLNQPHLAYMFAAEAQGLEEMRSLNCVRIPEVICHGQADGHSYLVLEYIELHHLDGQANKQLGQQLAQLHHHSQAFYGWHIDNTIGSTEQHNDRQATWLSFWQQQRLGQQLTIAKQHGYGGTLQDRGQRLIDSLPLFFDNYEPAAALLHGDLWGGNAASDPEGNPVIFDPACYYGDRETDIAMTELFGGFSREFYDAYQASYPLDSGYKTRKTLYNLYHIINHLNLFGGSYLSQSENMIEQLLAEI